MKWNWQELTDYRNLMATGEYGYELYVKGGGSHEFAPVVFYNNVEIYPNGKPIYCRNVPEAKRLAEAVAQSHFNK